MLPRERLSKALPWISTPLLFVLAIAIWKLVTVVFGVSKYVLPPPGAVATALADLVTQPKFWQVQVLTTLTEVVAGFVIAVVAGVVTGAVLGRILWLERATRPMIVASQVIPKVALIPLFVIWFGFGMTSKIIIAVILAFFPIMQNVLLGVRSVDPGHHDVMRSLNASRWETFRHLELPSTLPYVFAGMEVGIVFATIGAIVGEYLGGNEGLGYLVVRSLNSLDAPQLFAVIILLAGLGSVLFFTISGAKRAVIPWHESVTQKETA